MLNSGSSYLVNVLLESTLKYTIPRIHYMKDKEAFVRGMRECIYICTNECGDDVNAMKGRLDKLLKETPKKLIKRSTLFGDVNKFYILGLQQASQVVDSIVIRFEGCYVSDDKVFISNILERSKYEDRHQKVAQDH